MNFAGSRETSQEDSTEIQPPSTPHRDESAVQSQQKYRSGRKEEQPVKASSYVDMYEEANNLLNNLHFERVKRIHKDWQIMIAAIMPIGIDSVLVSQQT